MKMSLSLSERIQTGRIDRPDEWTMDGYSWEAKKLENKIAELEENSKYVRMGWTNLPQIYYAMQEEGQGAVFADEQLGCRHEVFVTESTWHELQDAIRKQASEL